MIDLGLITLYNNYLIYYITITNTIKFYCNKLLLQLHLYLDLMYSAIIELMLFYNIHMIVTLDGNELLKLCIFQRETFSRQCYKTS